jgi:hypothetical protein
MNQAAAAKAEKLGEAAGDAFSKGRYDQATRHYSEAVQIARQLTMLANAFGSAI